MLKYQHIEPGTRVRAHDFEPREGVSPKYVEGVVVRHDEMPSQPGALALVINCEVDTCWGSESYQGHEYTREGQEVYVPMQLLGTEYDGRVQICTERCDL